MEESAKKRRLLRQNQRNGLAEYNCKQFGERLEFEKQSKVTTKKRSDLPWLMSDNRQQKNSMSNSQINGMSLENWKYTCTSFDNTQYQPSWFESDRKDRANVNKNKQKNPKPQVYAQLSKHHHTQSPTNVEATDRSFGVGDNAIKGGRYHPGRPLDLRLEDSEQANTDTKITRHPMQHESVHAKPRNEHVASGGHYKTRDFNRKLKEENVNEPEANEHPIFPSYTNQTPQKGVATAQSQDKSSQMRRCQDSPVQNKPLMNPCQQLPSIPESPRKDAEKKQFTKGHTPKTETNKKYRRGQQTMLDNSSRSYLSINERSVASEFPLVANVDKLKELSVSIRDRCTTFGFPLIHLLQINLSDKILAGLSRNIGDNWNIFAVEHLGLRLVDIDHIKHDHSSLEERIICVFRTFKHKCPDIANLGYILQTMNTCKELRVDVDGIREVINEALKIHLPPV